MIKQALFTYIKIMKTLDTISQEIFQINCLTITSASNSSYPQHPTPEALEYPRLRHNYSGLHEMEKL